VRTGSAGSVRTLPVAWLRNADPLARRARRRCRALVAVHLAAALVATVLAGCGGGAACVEGAGAEYAALGDSDSSGAGIAPISDPMCFRSRVNYASLIAKELHYTSFKDVTCGGATTRDLQHSQTIGARSRPPQIEAVGSRTRLVTITIGLNDKSVSSALLYACLSSSGEVTAWCQQVLDVPEAAVDKLVRDAADRVEQALRLIRKKAPNATVVLVGYPRFLPDEGSCPDRVPFVEAMVPRVRAMLAEVDEQWREAADRAGAVYIDTYTLSEGHDVCAADPWVNGVADDPGTAAAMHPYEAFHRAVADAVVARLQRK
jgi:lysophospholipase L1-like esterase